MRSFPLRGIAFYVRISHVFRAFFFLLLELHGLLFFRHVPEADRKIEPSKIATIQRTLI